MALSGSLANKLADAVTPLTTFAPDVVVGGQAGGRHGRTGTRRGVAPQPVLVTGELVIGIPAPRFAVVGSVNDDEVVFELLLLDL